MDNKIKVNAQIKNNKEFSLLRISDKKSFYYEGS